MHTHFCFGFLLGMSITFLKSLNELFALDAVPTELVIAAFIQAVRISLKKFSHLPLIVFIAIAFLLKTLQTNV